ncbi:hypothetical protein D917_05860 [Trichinella nativa]|uniref:Uncharacterized protein n=1 Tax=Trichinella nativa TaxID=6335 RepID=A0A1Y3EYJ4_9BILA|nr:hypothetical protein D917_05860 [Trichinella nativa]
MERRDDFNMPEVKMDKIGMQQWTIAISATVILTPRKILLWEIFSHTVVYCLRKRWKWGKKEENC